MVRLPTWIPTLGPRARKVVRYGGYALLAIVTFVFAFQMTFPFDRVKDKVVDVLSDKYEVTIGDVERSLIPGKMYFKAVSLRTRPEKADDVATTFYIERLEVGIGLFALLRSTASIKLDAKIGPGHIKGNIALSKGGTSVDLVGEDLPSVSLPMREVIGLPMSGKLRFAFELDLPNEKSKTGKVGPNWVKAEGSAELECPSGCTVGDGKSKLRPKLKNRGQQAFAEGGIDFGKVTIDTLLAKVDIKNGKITVTRFDAKSTDGELHVDFDMALNQDLNSSNVTGCLRFRGSEALLKREAKTHAAISTTGAPLGPDNLFHIKLDGPLREVRRLGQVCGSGTDSATPTPSRPNLLPDTPTARPPPTAMPPQPGIPPAGTPPAAAPGVTPPGTLPGAADPQQVNPPISPQITPQVYPPAGSGSDIHAQPPSGLDGEPVPPGAAAPPPPPPNPNLAPSNGAAPQ